MADANDFTTLREKAGLTIRETALLLGKSERTVRRYETEGTSGTKIPTLVINTLKRVSLERCYPEVNNGRTFRFVDLFAGIGGLRIPFEEMGGQCVFTSEWDRFAKQTYMANFPDGEDHQFAGDIRPYAKSPELVPKHDVLLAGFPCQPFSIAGVSKNNSLGRPHGFMCDTQGTLFYDLAKIIRHHRPVMFLLENVKNLERHDSGKTFTTIKHVLEKELGYEIHVRVISSEPWVPQKRERIFIVGFRSRSSFNFDRLEVPDTDNPVLGDILEPCVDTKYTLSDKLWSYLKNYKKKHRNAGNGFGYSLFGPRDVTRTLSARYYKDGSEILVHQNGERPRRLTPRECARLMGFDELDTSNFKIPVSDTQAYRQFGNAVVVPVVRTVANLVKPNLYEALDCTRNSETSAKEASPSEARVEEMPDIVPPEVRSRMISSIKSVNTEPELALRTGLYRQGFRYRLHEKALEGKSDLVFPKYNAVIFVNGCFWHGHDCHLFRHSKSREELWKNKISDNIGRDKRNMIALKEKGWRIAQVWECALKGKKKKPLDSVLEECATWLRGEEKKLDIKGNE